MAATKPYLTKEDVLILRDACMFRFEQLSELSRDKRMPSDISKQILTKVNELHRVWSKLPDEGV